MHGIILIRMMKLKLGLYKHFKGMMYRVIDVVKHSETLEDMVLYEALYDNKQSKTWVRPLGMFTEFVERNGVRIPRFQYIGE